MKSEPRVSFASYTHFGYGNDQISEITYHSVRRVAAAGLLSRLYVLDVDDLQGLDPSTVSVPIPGGKLLPRALFLAEEISPIPTPSARECVSGMLDRLTARQLGEEDVVYLFPEFCRSADSATEKGITPVVYGRTCHPNETLELYEEERARFGGGIEIPRRWIHCERWTYEHADYLFYLSDYTKETYVENGFPEERLFKVGPLAVDTEYYSPTEDESDEFVVLAVSNMDALKGTVYLLDAWDMLEIENGKLVLCGAIDDAVRDVLQPRIDQSNSIEHLGHVDDVAAQYERASLFVHPSLTEAFGKVYAEAMASGVPVIATENGPGEYIEDAGIQVPIRDPEAIAEAIQYLFDNPGEARRMGRRGREIAETHTWDDFSQRVSESLDEVLRLEGFE